MEIRKIYFLMNAGALKAILSLKHTYVCTDWFILISKFCPRITSNLVTSFVHLEGIRTGNINNRVFYDGKCS